MSDQHLPIYIQLKLQSQPVRSLAAHDHSAKENFKIRHNRRHVGINIQRQRDGLCLAIQYQIGRGDRVVYAVVNIKRRKIGIAYTAAAYICFIGQDQCGGDSVHRNTGTFVMIADSGNNTGGVELIFFVIHCKQAHGKRVTKRHAHGDFFSDRIGL